MLSLVLLVGNEKLINPLLNGIPMDTPKTIEGLVVDFDQGRISIAPEFTPHRVSAETKDGKNGYALGFSYDPHKVIKVRTSIRLPRGFFQTVKLTQEKKSLESNDANSYRIEDYTEQTLRDHKGKLYRGKFLVSVNTGHVLKRRSLEGTLMPLGNRASGDNDSRITIINSKGTRTPVTVYRKLGLTNNSGHAVNLTEEFWVHNIDGMGHEPEFKQTLLDIETGESYEVSCAIGRIEPAAFRAWCKNAMTVGNPYIHHPSFREHFEQ